MTFSALLAFCAGNSSVTGEFLAQRPVTRSFDVFFDLRPNKHLNKQSWGWWFETQTLPLWRHYNVYNGDMTWKRVLHVCYPTQPCVIWYRWDPSTYLSMWRHSAVYWFWKITGDVSTVIPVNTGLDVSSGNEALLANIYRMGVCQYGWQCKDLFK